MLTHFTVLSQYKTHISNNLMKYPREIEIEVRQIHILLRPRLYFERFEYITQSIFFSKEKAGNNIILAAIVLR